MDVHQCPLCELRYASHWELETHLAEEHPHRIEGGMQPHGHRARAPHVDAHPSAPHAPAPTSAS